MAFVTLSNCADWARATSGSAYSKMATFSKDYLGRPLQDAYYKMKTTRCLERPLCQIEAFFAEYWNKAAHDGPSAWQQGAIAVTGLTVGACGGVQQLLGPAKNDFVAPFIFTFTMLEVYSGPLRVMPCFYAVDGAFFGAIALISDSYETMMTGVVLHQVLTRLVFPTMSRGIRYVFGRDALRISRGEPAHLVDFDTPFLREKWYDMIEDSMSSCRHLAPSTTQDLAIPLKMGYLLSRNVILLAAAHEAREMIYEGAQFSRDMGSLAGSLALSICGQACASTAAGMAYMKLVRPVFWIPNSEEFRENAVHRLVKHDMAQKGIPLELSAIILAYKG